ncbi:hypothetical protein, partial [Pseudomonas chlororaphis]|uniref:hypothetical protein n=1 Tax=Pseudomonas chlororaphis TaxID=587753 RepID=UPI001C0FB89D
MALPALFQRTAPPAIKRSFPTLFSVVEALDRGAIHWAIPEVLDPSKRPPTIKTLFFSLKKLPFVGFICPYEFCIKELTQCFHH